ncbi:MAG: VWA domain-containing protein, partial [Candidatus Cloacimonadaceae bacterium]|nr:VWA domain-containing protein [Candidatus Cloacimonadaceae bacterium]
NSPANTSYRCVLQLSTDQLSSWGLSTYLDDAPDDGECGFFLYTMEEDSIPADSTFAMRLNIVIDVSGSMSWEDRLVNAKAAAIWVINHLQPDDMFNIILFDHVVRPLWGVLRINNFTNRSIAIAYIEDYVMPGMNGTNLYGGLSHALSQFVPPPPGVKNCILLLSDGQPTFGVTDTYQILHNINATVAQYHTAPNIFCFGIGSEVNYQLLNALALYHSGISIFLESSEIVNTTTSFYTEMRNPITMYPEVTVTPGVAVIDVLPDPFPTIYGGMQYRLVGRYAVPGPITINLLGIHQGTPVSYFYNYDLNATEIPNLGFVPKVWASTKIDKMLIEYYSYPPQSPQAVALRQEIIDLSIAFGVVCVFTSFNPDPPVANDDATEELVPIPIKLLQNYPNPFNPSTTISFEVLADLQEEAELRIYNLKGQVVYVARIAVIGKGSYEFVWHGTDMQNKAVSSGVYIYSIRCGKHILHSRMTLCK